ncbi:MAG: hypothetical protein HY789_05270 [Deltaproteobacteria bacterium]|nr:hypothetical protein [Deltaproteobacteria bacterium]
MKKRTENKACTAVIDRYDYDEDIAEAASHVGTGTIFNLCALIGAWGVTCLGSAVVQFGIATMVKGWFAGITG